MRYGYWLPVFGGWLRNVADEGMEASWNYVSNLARRSEQLGYDLTLIAELNLNDIKGVEAPSLDGWSTAAALAAGDVDVSLVQSSRLDQRTVLFEDFMEGTRDTHVLGVIPVQEDRMRRTTHDGAA